jgi:hypothetical protein
MRSYSASSFLLSLLIVLVGWPPIGGHSAERHANLSYSAQHIVVLPELITLKMAPIERIIFLHIPKTAGTNLSNIVRAVQKTHFERLPVPRIPGISPTAITPGWLGGLQEIGSLPEPFFIMGHFPYGLHRQISKPCQYITLVRHPLTRELSSANFAYQRGYLDAQDVEAYLLERVVDNPQVRLIAGMMEGLCTEETFILALENIERDFFLVAPSSEVDLFLQILSKNQGWGPVAYAPMQVTNKKAIEHLDPFLKNALLKKHAWDAKLYAWVKKRWNQYKKEMVLGYKALQSTDRILTLMPDHLTTRTPRFLSIEEIEAHNRAHEGEDLLELEQVPYVR